MDTKSSHSTPIIEAIGLEKIFYDFWYRPRAYAVNKIDFTIYPGKVVGFLGPNGSGKSTTVKMILGLLRPTRGSLRVFGSSPRNVEIKRRIGYLPEETYLYKYLTSEETLDFFGSLFSLPSSIRRQRIEELLQMVGMQRSAKRCVGEFSKGMARRIGLAQALINDPDLVILDEPTSGLDPIGCREIKDIIRILAKRGKTVLLCSHLLADVEDVCDEIYILYGGVIRAHGPINEILKIQDQWKITIPKLTDESLQRILSAIYAELSDQEKDKVKIDFPKKSLETFFLEVIERARQEQLTTSGAEVGQGIASFLRKINEDIDTGEEPLSHQSTPAEQQTTPSSKVFLDKLASLAKDEETSPSPIPKEKVISPEEKKQLSKTIETLLKAEQEDSHSHSSSSSLSPPSKKE